jgi:hypothetical protein
VTSRPRRYRLVNLALAGGFLLLLAAPRAFVLTPSGDGLMLLNGFRGPELCLRKRLTGRPSSSCHLGRSVVLATHGMVGESIARHPGGVLLWGWLAAQVVLRLGFSAAPFKGRLWWLDVALTMTSLLVVCSVVAILRSPMNPS